MDCASENFLLTLISTITSILWFLSEVIGSSKCESNGVMELLMNGCCIIKTEEVE